MSSADENRSECSEVNKKKPSAHRFPVDAHALIVHVFVYVCACVRLPALGSPTRTSSAAAEAEAVAAAHGISVARCGGERRAEAVAEGNEEGERKRAKMLG